MDLSLHVGRETIRSVSVVRDLGVLLDEEMTMNQHISNSMRAEHNRDQTDLWAMGTYMPLAKLWSNCLSTFASFRHKTQHKTRLPFSRIMC